MTDKINDGVPGLGVGDTLTTARRQQEMAAAWQAYLGKLEDSLTPEPGQPNVNVKSNRLAPIVDTGVYYLFGLPLTVEVDPDASRSEEAQAYLDGCWGDEDDRMTLLAKLAMNGAIFGHAFAKILPPNEATGRQYPRLVVLDPQTVTVQTDPDDCDAVLSYTIAYDATLPDNSVVRKRQVIARRDAYDATQSTPVAGDSAATLHSISAGDNADDGSDAQPAMGSDVGWVITTSVRRGEGGAWTPVGADVPWEHPWPPMIDCQNLPISNQHWGMPDLTPDLIQLNRVLNFVLSNINAIAHSHGHPWVWAAGVDVSQIQTAPGRIIGLPMPDAKLSALIANGDIAGLMAYAADLRSSMDEMSKVPGVATGRIAELPRGQMSGVSLRMLYQPLLFKTTFKRRPYGKLVREASTRMLALGGFGDGTDRDGVPVNTHWKDPMPTDDLQEAQTALAWEQIGVSADTLMQRGGFDPDAEAAKVEAANERQMQLQSQGKAPMPGISGMMPPPLAQSPAQPTPPQTAPTIAPTTPPPVNHPAAVAARQAAQAAAGKRVTPGGLK